MRAGGLWFACTALLVLGSCTGGVPDNELAAALANMAPSASRFASFESWARRAYSVADPKASERSLGETLFAPLRNDRELFAAWIQVGTKSPRVLSLPTTARLPDMREWTSVREPSLGWLRVARFAECPVETPNGWREEPHPACVIVSRDLRGDNHSEPRVTMAFIVPASTRAGTTDVASGR